MVAQQPSCPETMQIKFSRATMLAEKDTASTNFALAYFIKGARGLPPGVSLETATEFYFSCCSIQVQSHRLSKHLQTNVLSGLQLPGLVTFWCPRECDSVAMTPLEAAQERMTAIYTLQFRF